MYMTTCPVCRQNTLICVDNHDHTETHCECTFCGYSSVTTLDEVVDEDDDDE